MFLTKLLRHLMLLVVFVLAGPSLAQGKIGIVLMHGKTGGGERDRSLDRLTRQMLSKGMLVIRPQMPWSRDRYLDGDWSLAMREIQQHVETLRAQGATKVVLAGHSIGSPAAISYAANHKNVDAIVMIAPGHIPYYYYECIPFSPIKMCAVKESVDQARKLVAEGKGDEKARFNDINQGSRLPVFTTANAYLSYFDPGSNAEMAVSALTMPNNIPVLWIIGFDDYLIREGRQYVFDKLPPNPKSKYLEISGNHFNTPAVGAGRIVEWIEELD